MSARRLTIRSRLGLGYAAVLLVSGAVLLAGAYLVVARASTRYDRAVVAQVERSLADRRARMFPESPAPPRDVPFPGERRAERRATVAAQRDALPGYRREIALWFVALLATVSVASLGVGRVLAARALLPVREITRAARGIGEEDLGRRLATEGPDDELTDLARTLDGMLERIQAAFVAQSAFAAHASHELRTPLSVIRAEIDACLDREETPADQWRRSAEVVRRNAVRSERLVQQLLLLARARVGPAVPHRVDLAEIAQSLLDDLPGGYDVQCRLGEAPTRGDPALLEAAVANLLENAARHNVESGAIELASWTERGRACLTVGNDGPTIDASDVEHLLEPFVRGRHDGPGTGLGLAIVHTIVRSHRGTVEAAARPGGGLRVTVRLPRTNGTDTHGETPAAASGAADGAGGVRCTQKPGPTPQGTR
jgi:signal transduction histidine kinase